MKKIGQGALLLLTLALLFCGLAAAEEPVSISPATLSTMTPATGEEITATINATGAYAYNFWLFDEHGTIVQQKTNTTDTEWKFTVSAPGIYLLRTYATNFVTEDHADTEWFAVTGGSPVVTVSHVAVSGDFKVGASLTASATVENAFAYNYWLFNDQGTIVREHTNTTDTSWTFSVADEGVYLMRIYATNFETEAHADSEWFYIASDVPQVIVGDVKLEKTNYVVGETLHIDAMVNRDAGLCAFNYWVFDSAGAIVMEKTNTFDPTADFELTTPGVYLVRVYATNFVTDAHNDSEWFGVAEAPAEDIDYTYTVQDGYVTITGYTGSSDADIVIPSAVAGLPVRVIGDYAFTERDDLTGTLTIPGSVTNIGEYAFYGCEGFTGSLTIPNSVTSIGDYAFAYCSGVTGSLTIPDSVTSLSEGAFAGCSGFTGSLTIPASVTSIGGEAFADCIGFTGGLTIPASVTSIGEWAFDGCSGFTGSLTIPASVISIGERAFRGCSGFTGSLTIPAGVTSIGNEAFKDCYGFTGSLTIPAGVTSIGERTFRNCHGFTGSLTIPESVTTIGNGAFRDCYGFTGSLTIPDSVTSIGGGAFEGCSGFTGSLTLSASVTSIGETAFWECSQFTGSLTIPAGVTSIGMGAFFHCRGFTGSLTIPDSVTSIGDDAFYECSFTEYHAAPGSYAERWLRDNGYIE